MCKGAPLGKMSPSLSLLLSFLILLVDFAFHFRKIKFILNNLILGSEVLNVLASSRLLQLGWHTHIPNAIDNFLFKVFLEALTLRRIRGHFSCPNALDNFLSSSFEGFSSSSNHYGILMPQIILTTSCQVYLRFQLYLSSILMPPTFLTTYYQVYLGF